MTLPSGTRYAFVGDIVWQLEGITEREERPRSKGVLLEQGNDPYWFPGHTVSANNLMSGSGKDRMNFLTSRTRSANNCGCGNIVSKRLVPASSAASTTAAASVRQPKLLHPMPTERHVKRRKVAAFHEVSGWLG